MDAFTPKQRMLNAYRGQFSDRYPVAPEFWYYYPAKVLGVKMVTFEREIPHWQALLATFRHYGTDGWGIASPRAVNPDVQTRQRFEHHGTGSYVLETDCLYRDHTFHTVRLYSDDEPSWMARHMINNPDEIGPYMDMMLEPGVALDFADANQAHRSVGEAYLLELNLGVPFFDFFEGAMGFEKAIYYFAEEDEGVLQDYRDRYEASQLRLVDAACANTAFESFFIGCSSSCNSLLGPALWRKYDKPGLGKIAARLHEHGRLLHVHFHGRSMETVADFAEIGLDCVCPFERGPGGDIRTPAYLRRVRALLGDRVTFNGNIHTVETLIRGTPADVVREVAELKEAFAGSARLIIGTGDQVGKETKEENLLAMIEAGKSM